MTDSRSDLGTGGGATTSPVLRLLEGAAQGIAAKGYHDTTIADIVRGAGVSKRTFYEHFATKAECLIALYNTASLVALDVLRQAIDRRRPWEDQLEDALTAYFAAMAASPALTRTLFVEILGLGDEGLAARRRVHDRIAELILEVANGGSLRRPSVSPQMASAIVGAIHELVLIAIEANRVSSLAELAGPASALVRAVVLGAAQSGPRRQPAKRRRQADD